LRAKALLLLIEPCVIDARSGDSPGEGQNTKQFRLGKVQDINMLSSALIRPY